MNKKVFLVVMAGLLCSKGLLAEEQPRSFVGEEMVVTATKTFNSVSDAGGASVTVITADQIKASGKNSVEELLKGTIGLDVVANGGLGAQESLFIRGGDAKNTLVLLDGVSVNDPSTINRTANISHLTLDNIERIEVVRGPLSVLYGSNATAGVINIITRKGQGPLKAYASVEGGSYGTWKVSGGVNGKTGNSGYSVALSRQQSNGFSFADDRNQRIPHNGNTSEKDSYENTTLSASWLYDLSPKSVLETTFRYTGASVKYDENANGYTGDRFNFNMTTYVSEADPYGLKERHNDNQQYIGRVALKNTGNFVVSTLFFQFSDEGRSDFNNDGDKETTYKGRSYEAGWQGDLHLADSNTLTFGVSGKNETMTYNAYAWVAPVIDRGMLSWNSWLQDQWSISGVKLVGGIRYEGNEMFGNKVTARIAPSYSIGSTVFKASYGTGFLAPSLYQLYSEYGLQTLKPESSRGMDAGVEQLLLANLRAGVTWFNTIYDNRIDFDPLAGPMEYGWPKGQYYQPEGESTSRGIESFVEWTPLTELQFAMNYTYNKTQNPYGVALVRRPENKAGLTGTYRFGKKGSLSATAQWVGERSEVPSAKDSNGKVVGTLPDYFLLNLAGSYNVSKQVELYGRIDNLFDTWYEEAWGYATPGRSAYAGIKLMF
ncbi:MAG: TonB-dependent receptor plug domain-containing protein [Chlorobium sp.]